MHCACPITRVRQPDSAHLRCLAARTAMSGSWRLAVAHSRPSPAATRGLSGALVPPPCRLASPPGGGSLGLSESQHCCAVDTRVTQRCAGRPLVDFQPSRRRVYSRTGATQAKLSPHEDACCEIATESSYIEVVGTACTSAAREPGPQCCMSSSRSLGASPPAAPLPASVALTTTRQPSAERHRMLPSPVSSLCIDTTVAAAAGCLQLACPAAAHLSGRRPHPDCCRTAPAARQWRHPSARTPLDAAGPPLPLPLPVLPLLRL